MFAKRPFPTYPEVNQKYGKLGNKWKRRKLGSPLPTPVSPAR
jgi:hypothetical protein